MWPDSRSFLAFWQVGSLHSECLDVFLHVWIQTRKGRIELSASQHAGSARSLRTGSIPLSRRLPPLRRAATRQECTANMPANYMPANNMYAGFQAFPRHDRTTPTIDIADQKSSSNAGVKQANCSSPKI